MDHAANEAAARDARELGLQAGRRRRSKDPELAKLEARRKRHGHATPLRPYGWEDVTMTYTPSPVRDSAELGTLSERRRRPRPLNPYYDGVVDKRLLRRGVVEGCTPAYTLRYDGALVKQPHSVRVCARHRRGTPTTMPHRCVIIRHTP
eukprot:SAG11_NODE_12220_length_715_cov_0.823052_1_plen_149_part_00